MGVESKFYFVKDYGFGYLNKLGKTESEIIAMIDVLKFGYTDESQKFKKLFNKECPFCLYLPTCDDDGNEIMGFVDENPYGNKITYGDYTEIIPQLQEVIKEYKELGWSTHRIKPLLAMMKEFSKLKDEEIYCVLWDY